MSVTALQEQAEQRPGGQRRRRRAPSAARGDSRARAAARAVAPRAAQPLPPAPEARRRRRRSAARRRRTACCRRTARAYSSELTIASGQPSGFADVAADHRQRQHEGDDLEPGGRRAPEREGGGEQRLQDSQDCRTAAGERRPRRHGLASRGERAAACAQLLRATCTRISLGLTMPSSVRAFSSTISRPSFRSRPRRRAASLRRARARSPACWRSSLRLQAHDVRHAAAAEPQLAPAPAAAGRRGRSADHAHGRRAAAAGDQRRL